MDDFSHIADEAYVHFNHSRNAVEDLLSGSGVTINGSQSWDPQICDDRFYKRVLREGSLGLGESYMDGWWECKAIDEFIYHLLRTDVKKKLRTNIRLVLYTLMVRIFNMQSMRRAFVVGERHYNTDNELFSRMLDPYMTYSCGYWHNACSLTEAQKQKLDLVCRKIGLREGMTVLDIGCGWGSFARYAAEHYGARVTGITVSNRQVEYARQALLGLPVDIRLQDYRSLNGQYDRIVSIGMFEHVGLKNYRTFMRVAHRCLSDDGLFLLHTIGSNESACMTDPWIEKYIFPNGILPSIKQIGEAIEGVFTMEDWHNFSCDYDRTLMSWHENFVRCWDSIKHRYDERFYRMWRYYLLACAGAFRARKNQLWQIVLSKSGVPGGYRPIRY
jgi:cyclopropane-fatty-acyl-phospholipid synthase